VSALVLLVSIILLGPEFVSAQGTVTDYVREHYVRTDHMVPMRDGVRLFTSVWSPKDTSRELPILLSRTPYDADNYVNPLGPSEAFVRDGYHIVYQDVRGRYLSEGDFVNMRPQNPNKSGNEIDESSDTWDTIVWLVQNTPNNNGNVGLWGISYLGLYTVLGMIDAHPALKAASPQAPVTDWFVGDDFHHNGAFFLNDGFDFMSAFGVPRPRPTDLHEEGYDKGTPDSYDFFLRMGPLANADKEHFKGAIPFWNEMMRHGTYDEFWKVRSPLQHLTDIRPATLTVAGWFDAEDLWGTLEVYQTLEKNNPGLENMLVMGPWEHAGWWFGEVEEFGDLRFNQRTTTFYVENMLLPFFNHHLKDGPAHELPEAWVFDPGVDEWKQFPSWPPPGVDVVPLRFGEAGTLVAEGVTGIPPKWVSPRSDVDEFVSDPSNPVPYIGITAEGRDATYMVADQRFASKRPDVLTYETAPLTEAVTVAGPITARLFVSTTGTDSDWVVKLVDVYPDDTPDNEPNPGAVRMGGYQQLVRGEVMRGKFRNSLEVPEPFVPDQVTEVTFTLPDAFHTFLPGHRIMVQVQSSWFPLVDRNPQTFTDIYSATEDDFKTATHRLFRSRSQSSRVELTVLRR